MKLSAVRILQLTTGKMYTHKGDIYNDLKLFTGIPFVEHQLPSAANALTPFLETRYGELRADSDDIEVRPLTGLEMIEFKRLYKEHARAYPMVAFLDAGCANMD